MWAGSVRSSERKKGGGGGLGGGPGRSWGSYRLPALSVQVQPSVRRIHVRAGEGVREAREAPINAPPITAGRSSAIGDQLVVSGKVDERRRKPDSFINYLEPFLCFSPFLLSFFGIKARLFMFFFSPPPRRPSVSSSLGLQVICRPHSHKVRRCDGEPAGGLL